MKYFGTVDAIDVVFPSLQLFLTSRISAHILSLYAIPLFFKLRLWKRVFMIFFNHVPYRYYS